MEAVREELREAHMDDPALVRKTVMEHLAQHIPVAAPSGGRAQPG